MTCWRRLKLPRGGAASSSTLVAFRQKNGARWSTAAAYLRPALDRPNLTVITGATTTKIRLEGRRAVGVNYIRHGQLEQAAGEYEVILCGGTVNSPHLLLLSGIAPADELRSSGVDVIHDLPGVGKNLQDHLGAYMCWEINQPSVTNWLRRLSRGFWHKIWQEEALNVRQLLRGIGAQKSARLCHVTGEKTGALPGVLFLHRGKFVPDWSHKPLNSPPGSNA